MHKQTSFSFNKSSLVSLQAELARKKEEASNVKKDPLNGSGKLQIKPHILQEINVRKEVKADNNISEKPEECSESNLAVENHIRHSLLAKSELYDKLRSRELVSEENDQFLVNFEEQYDEISKDEEKYDDDSDPESEWVTFTDTLGRSRTCLRTDLDYYKKLDSRLKFEEPIVESLTSEKSTKPVSQEILLWEKRRDELRKMWEEEEIRLSKKTNIHYQDVLFDEARTHGVGYFSFSQDENERAVQQEALKDLRRETEKNQKIASNVKERREQLMKQRIAAAKRRKRIQMGLPPDVDDEEKDITRSHDGGDQKFETQVEGPLEQKVDEFLNSMKRTAHVRPWDVGKDGVKPPVSVLSQHEWNEKQRAKRPAEFAPPSASKFAVEIEDLKFSYSISKKLKSHKAVNSFEKMSNYSECIDRNEEISNGVTNKKLAEIPPPTSYEKPTDRERRKCNIEESIEAGLNFLKSKQNKSSKNVEERIRRDYN